jgi:hypothetical protein
VLGSLGVVFDGKEEARRVKPWLTHANVEVALLPSALIGQFSERAGVELKPRSVV